MGKTLEGFEYQWSATDFLGGTIFYKEGENGYIIPDPAFVRDRLVVVRLPIFDKEYRMHKFMQNPLCSALRQLEKSGFSDFIKTCDGVFVPRHIGRDITKKLSRHSWGLAIDINAAENPQGTKGNQNNVVVNTFKQFGFLWGGDWRMPYTDPMHFEM